MLTEKLLTIRRADDADQEASEFRRPTNDTADSSFDPQGSFCLVIAALSRRQLWLT
ncbi:hypothetical protein HN51_031386, partial [Arachis hypogaea]